MKSSTRRIWRDIAITIPITFAVTAAVTYLYSLIAHEAGVVDWETAFLLALLFGIALPLIRARRDAPPS